MLARLKLLLRNQLLLKLPLKLNSQRQPLKWLPKTPLLKAHLNRRLPNSYFRPQGEQG